MKKIYRRYLNKCTDDLMQLYMENLNDCEIAKIAQVTPSAVWQWRRRNNLTPNAKSGKPKKIIL